MNPTRVLLLSALLAAQSACVASPKLTTRAPQSITYRKLEFNIPMRDGVKLYTAVYVPSGDARQPIMLERTPYGCGPYGPEANPRVREGKFTDTGYIIAYQDVRGRFMSEGKFEEIRPLRSVQGEQTVDESTDAYDTVDFLIKNVPNNNGRVGVRGVSYPGFYAACAAVNNHPAVKAVSPGAPVAEWFFGDDVHHNGAFYLLDNFDFYFGFGYDMDKPAPQHPQIAPMGQRPDSYKFFLEQGSPDMLEKKFFQSKFPFWRDIIEHPSYDAFWKARSTPIHMKNVKCAVLTVGGLFDAEDLYGPWAVYANVERMNPGIQNSLVMGPWSHGGWFGPGTRFGTLEFGERTGDHFRNEIEFPFFESHLRGDGSVKLPEVKVFNTGANKWREFDKWPPKGSKPYSLYLGADKRLIESPGASSSDSYVSDPRRPVPYLDGTLGRRNSGYMAADQTFASKRDDVLTYMTEPLAEELTIGGPITATMFVDSTSTDLDLVCKVIDVYPADAGDLGDKQILVRADPMPVRFRESFENPIPLKPGEVVKVGWVLPDVLHTFKKGHRVMIQVQSSWFPLVAMSPQVFGNPYKIPPSEWQRATVRLHHGSERASRVEFGRL